MTWPLPRGHRRFWCPWNSVPTCKQIGGECNVHLVHIYPRTGPRGGYPQTVPVGDWTSTAHVLHLPPPPPRAPLCNRCYSKKHTYGPPYASVSRLENWQQLERGRARSPPRSRVVYSRRRRRRSGGILLCLCWARVLSGSACARARALSLSHSLSRSLSHSLSLSFSLSLSLGRAQNPPLCNLSSISGHSCRSSAASCSRPSAPS